MVLFTVSISLDITSFFFLFRIPNETLIVIQMYALTRYILYILFPCLFVSIIISYFVFLMKEGVTLSSLIKCDSVSNALITVEKKMYSTRRQEYVYVCIQYLNFVLSSTRNDEKYPDRWNYSTQTYAIQQITQTSKHENSLTHYYNSYRLISLTVNRSNLRKKLPIFHF